MSERATHEESFNKTYVVGRMPLCSDNVDIGLRVLTGEAESLIVSASFTYVSSYCKVREVSHCTTSTCSL